MVDVVAEVVNRHIGLSYPMGVLPCPIPRTCAEVVVEHEAVSLIFPPAVVFEVPSVVDVLIRPFPD